jgi:hypothetical protein
MPCNLYELIDLGTELLDWQLATPEGQQPMAADLRLLGELQAITAQEGAAPETRGVRPVGWGPFWGPTQTPNP